MESSNNTPRSSSVDLSHHLSELSRRRGQSPLKGLFKYWQRPGMIPLAGGLPSPTYFPFESISGQALIPTTFALQPSTVSSTAEESSSFSWLWKILGLSEKTTHEVSIPKYANGGPTAVQLATALQYGTAAGLLALQTFIHEFTSKVYQPGYSDWTTLVHVGNTDGWSKAVATLCNAREGILTEEWTYPSALASAWPLGVTPVGIGMDAEGMRADLLEEVLGGWDENARGGMKRPHVMYTIPVGQNPAGTTMGAERRKAIYAICVEYDVIIVEDDPYYFLQVGKYTSRYQRLGESPDSDDEAFLRSLSPSYVRFDYQGRVIRLETFSKTIAPGCRLGWFTCNPLFAERLERQGETSTQAPSGFGQALVTQLLVSEWGYNGYIRWLRGLRAQYETRRDVMLDSLADEFDLKPDVEYACPFTSGIQVLAAREKRRSRSWNLLAEEKVSTDDKILFTFVPPSAGMFVWIKVHMYNHPLYDPNPLPEAETLEYKLWVELAENNLLVVPGNYFATPGEGEPNLLLDIAVEEKAKYGHFRLSYSESEFDVMKSAIKIFGRVLRDFFNHSYDSVAKRV